MEKVQFFSEKTGNFYQLIPTRTIPVLKINGVPMHRYIRIDPLTDTQLKIAAVKPRGKVLDVCTGLGYTAIYSAKKEYVKEVVTIEKDFEVLKIARMNEASKELFENPKIKIINGNACLAVRNFDDESFDCIIHDPPTFVISPELYHVEFYKELYRVLKKYGVLWHYAPEPGKMKSKGNDFVRKIILNLNNIGFKRLRKDVKSSGILAIK